MIRKFTVCLMLSAWFLASSCDDEEAASPPKSSLDVNVTTGLANDTEFTFTVTQVNADAVTLYPYGIAKAVWGTITITDFEDGVAVVPFTYAQVGTFEAVVVSNNHTADGSSVKNSVSNAETITITSNRNSLTAFTLSFKKDEETTISSTKTVIDQVGHTIDVTMPYGVNVANLIANFTVSPFATVSVGGVEQTSGSTVNNFTTDKTYVVTSQDGDASVNWNVHVDVIPAETWTGFKSFKGKLTSTAVKDREVSAYVDSVNNYIVIYDEPGAVATSFDSVEVTYALGGNGLATLKSGTTDVKQNDRFNFSANDKTLTVVAQDPAVPNKVYNVYWADAPTLKLSFEELNPVVEATSKDFKILLKALSQPVKVYETTATITTLPAGVTVDEIRADGDVFSDGMDVDYTKDVKFEIDVTDTNLPVGKQQFTVVYTVTVGQL